MMIEQFNYQGEQVRTFTDERTGEPWFVATDVARILGYREAKDMTRRLDEEDKGRRSVPTPGGAQQVTVISEPGLYVAVLGSQIPGARDFKRWITHEVLPAIRKTGSYALAPVPELSGAELMARAVLEAQQTLEAREARIRELQPKADVFDELLTAEGSYSVGDAAKILTRAGIDVGQNRLFKQLDGLGWTFRKAFKRHVSQKAVEQGLIVTKPQTYAHPKTGERVIGDPQIRVTAKGLYRLRDELQPRLELEGVAA